MRSPPIGQAEIEIRIGEHLDELLELWWAEQGAAKIRDLDLIAAALPFSIDQTLRVLDLCCGPGDVGRAVQRRFPKATVDGVDRDPFLTSIRQGVNGRSRAKGETFVRDLNDLDWQSDLSPPYDAIAIANALHWFTHQRAREILADGFGLIRQGGAIIMVEPTLPECAFREGFKTWKSTQPARYSQDNWLRFWSRANQLLGYDHTKLLGQRGAKRIGEEMSVAGWVGLLSEVGFVSADVLLRDADEVLIGAIRP